MNAALEPVAEPTQLEPGIVYQIPVEALSPDPLQPRKHIDQDALASFAADIKARGVLMPISAWEMDEGLRIKSGERRWRAAQLAGLKTVPVLIEDRPPDLDSRFDQVAENTQRESLSEADQLRFLGQLREEGATVNDLAAALAKRGIELGPKDIAKRLEVLTLPEAVVKLLDKGVTPETLAPLADLADVPGLDWNDVANDLAEGIDWRGGLHVSEVKSTAKTALRDLFTDLDSTGRWHDEPVPFAWKTRCKKCPHLLKFDGAAFCTDAKLYAEHAAEARAAGLDFGGQAVAQPKATAGATCDALPLPPPKPEESISWKVRARNYLHLRELGALEAVDWFDVRYANVVAALNAWAADGSPGAFGRRHGAPEFDQLDAYLEATGGTGLSPEERAKHVALSLDLEHARDLLHVIHGPDLLAWWVLDDEFLQLFKGAQLKALLEEHVPGLSTTGKVSVLRAGLVEAWPASPWVPPVLAKLYAPRIDALMPDDEDEDSDEAYPEDADEDEGDDE